MIYFEGFPDLKIPPLDELISECFEFQFQNCPIFILLHGS